MVEYASLDEIGIVLYCVSVDDVKVGGSHVVGCDFARFQRIVLVVRDTDFSDVMLVRGRIGPKVVKLAENVVKVDESICALDLSQRIVSFFNKRNVSIIIAFSDEVDG